MRKNGEVGSKGWSWEGLGEWSDHGAYLTRRKARGRESWVKTAQPAVQCKEDRQGHQRVLEPKSATREVLCLRGMSLF